MTDDCNKKRLFWGGPYALLQWLRAGLGFGLMFWLGSGFSLVLDFRLPHKGFFIIGFFLCDYLLSFYRKKVLPNWLINTYLLYLSGRYLFNMFLMVKIYILIPA